MEFTLNQILEFVRAIQDNFIFINNLLLPTLNDAIEIFKKGNKIKIKKLNRGKFTEFCGGKVTLECISRGKNSLDPKIRKRATFAANSRKWDH